jgi:pimeloyl-ACP methyl ester carboxylesterase
MPHFHHDSGSLHYLERGSGQPLLLIHGLGASGADWAMQVAALEGRFRVIVPDLPGCGHSGAITEDCSIPSLAASLWRLLDSLCGSPVNIIGFSLGGAVALEMALQRPACVPRLALINSLASYQIDDPRKWIEARLTCALISLFGMRMVGRLFAARLFPHPWQLPMVERDGAVVPARKSDLDDLRGARLCAALGKAAPCRDSGCAAHRDRGLTSWNALRLDSRNQYGLASLVRRLSIAR